MVEEIEEGLPVFNKQQPSQTQDGLPILKKKTSLQGSNNGSSSSVNGLGSFQNSLPNTNTSLDFSPVTDNAERQRLQQRDNDIRAKRQAEQQRLSKQIQSQLSAYDKAHPDNKQTAEQIASVGAYYQSKDKLRQPTEEELAHEKFMDTTVGKILAPVAYLGSKATKGTNQILRGAAYLANRANLQGAMDLASGANPDALTNPALDVLDEEANYGLTKNDVSHLEESKVLTNLGGLAEFLPTMAGAGATGGSTFYLQGFGMGQETIEQAEKNGTKVNPAVREGFILGTGLANGYLMKVLGEGVFGKLPAGLRNDIAAKISADAVKEAAGKELTGAEFKSLLESGADKFRDRVSKFGLDAIKGYNKATVDLSALAGANFALKKGADIANDQPIFNESVGDLAEQVAHVATEAAPFFAAAGAIPNAGRLVRYNKDRNSVIESIMNDSSPENIDRIKQDLYNEGFNREADQWTPEEMDATFKQVDNIANVAKRLPKNIATDKLESAVDLIQGKEELQRRVADLQAARNEFDDSVKDIPTPEEQLLTDKVEQANDKLRDITTGNRTTYSKGTGEEEGKFYKTTNGVKEEISPSRYELEALEREARADDNKPQESPQETVVTEENVPNKPVTEETKLQEQTQEPIPNDQRTETTVPEETIQPTQEQPIEAETNRTEVAKDSPTETLEAVEATKDTEPTITTAKPKETSIEPINESETKARNATTDEVLKKYDLEIKLNDGKRTREVVEAEANERLKDGYDVNGLVEKIRNDKHQASDTETIILAKHLGAQDSRISEINSRLETEGATMSDKTFADLSEEKTKLLSDIEETGTALKETGRATARGLGVRRFAVQNDYSLANMIERTRREGNSGKKLTPEQLTEVETKYRDLQKKEADLQAHVERLTKENTELRADKSIDRIKREAALEVRRSSRKQTKEQIDAEIAETKESFLKRLKSQRSNLSVNPIPVEALGDVAKLVKLYAKKGITTTTGIVDQLYNDLKDSFDDLTKDHVLESLSNLPEGAESTKDPLAAYKSRMKSNLNKLRGKTEANDFTREKRQPLQLDKEGLELRDALEKARYDWELGLHREALKNRSQGKKVLDAATEVLNVPRALLASTDLSAPLRQGIVLTTSHPIVGAKAFAKMLQFAVSDKAFDRWFYDLRESNDYRTLKESKLYIADPHKPELSAKEEQFMTNLAEKIPVIGRLVKGSERAYIGYLNKMRVDIFRQAADLLERDGKTFENSPELYKGLAKWVNNATGRGSLWKENAAQTLNLAFFSPRLMASRINLLNPQWYSRLPKEVRVMALRDMAKFVAVGSTIMGLAYLNGAQVELDPRSSDFGKIRNGNTRYDIWGGFIQYARFIAQISSGQTKNVQTGQIKNLGEDKSAFGQTRLDVLSTFFRNKLSPVPALVINAMAGENSIGEPFDIKTDIPKSLIPLVIQDTYKAIQDEGLEGGLKIGVPATFGVGVQSYDSGQKEKEYGMSDKIQFSDDQTYILKGEQLKEREKFNKEFFDTELNGSLKDYEEEVQQSKDYKDAKNKIAPLWLKQGMSQQEVNRQLDIIKNNLLKRKIQREADKYSRELIIEKYYDPQTNTLDLELSEE